MVRADYADGWTERSRLVVEDVDKEAETSFNVYRDEVFFFQAEDGIRDAQESRGLGDVYKRQDYSGI